MSRKNRWAYMSDPRFNRPTDDCPDCEMPSRIFHVGSRTLFREDGSSYTTTRWKCDHRHIWTVDEERSE